MNYRVVERPDGWIVEILSGLPVSLGEATIITPEWVKHQIRFQRWKRPSKNSNDWLMNEYAVTGPDF